MLRSPNHGTGPKVVKKYEPYVMPDCSQQSHAVNLISFNLTQFIDMYIYMYNGKHRSMLLWPGKHG